MPASFGQAPPLRFVVQHRSHQRLQLEGRVLQSVHGRLPTALHVLHGGFPRHTQGPLLDVALRLLDSTQEAGGQGKPRNQHTLRFLLEPLRVLDVAGQLLQLLAGLRLALSCSLADPDSETKRH